MNNTELKPCPFCGGKAYKRIAFPIDEDGMEMNMYIVGCKTCDIEFSWLWDEECAIELWNTRKPMDNIVAELEEELEEANIMWDNGEFYRGVANGVSYAIDTVKRGGTDSGKN